MSLTREQAWALSEWLLSLDAGKRAEVLAQRASFAAASSDV